MWKIIAVVATWLHSSRCKQFFTVQTSFHNNQVLKLKNTDLVFATFHVDVGETPFFLSIDYDKKVIVISIRGTLSMKVPKQSVVIQIV